MDIQNNDKQTEEDDLPLVLDQYGRRRFIGVAGITALGSLIFLEETKAGFFGFGYDASPVRGIDPRWVKAKGLEVNRYANFVKDLGLKHITPRMVLAPHFKTRGGVINHIPPRKTWKKMAPSLKAMDLLSQEMGAPVKAIVSAYRFPRYNRAVGGKSHSYHMNNQALDMQFYGASPWRVASVARFLRKKGKFSGGVGRYSTFVHMDTRGYNADW